VWKSFNKQLFYLIRAAFSVAVTFKAFLIFLNSTLRVLSFNKRVPFIFLNVFLLEGHVRGHVIRKRLKCLLLFSFYLRDGEKAYYYRYDLSVIAFSARLGGI